jgi:Ankyrin repeats (3 copies)
MPAHIAQIVGLHLQVYKLCIWLLILSADHPFFLSAFASSKMLAMSIDPFSAPRLSATIVSLVDLARSLTRERHEPRIPPDGHSLFHSESEQLSGSLPGLECVRTPQPPINADRLDSLCLVSTVDSHQELTQCTGSPWQYTPQCEAWDRLHALIRALNIESPNRLETHAITVSNYKAANDLDRYQQTTTEDCRESRRVIFVTRLSDAPQVIEAISCRPFPEIPELGRRVAALVILDNLSLRIGLEPNGSPESRLIQDLHAVEKIFSLSVDVQGLGKSFRISVVTDSLARQRRGVMETEFNTRYLLRHTTICGCLVEEIFDCTMWSIWQIAEDIVAGDISSQLNMSHLNLGSLDSRHGSVLMNSIQGKSQTEVCVILEACQWVAWSFRHLHTSELSEALKFSTSTQSCQKSVDGSKQDLPVVVDVMSLCKHVLSVKEDETVEFRDEGMQSFFRSSDHSMLRDLPCGHEVIARSCLMYLLHSNPATIFRPWVDFEHYLQDVYSSCGLRSYAITYWHRHYLLAEASSQHLPALLHYIIASAFPVETGTQISGHGFYSRRNDLGLELCVIYGFKVLGCKLMSMGANANSFGFMTQEPLLFIAVVRSPQMIEPLLQGGADIHQQDLGGATALHIAVALGNAAVISVLLDHGMDIKNSGSGTGCRRCNELMAQLLLMAVNGRHIDMVRCLVEVGASLKQSNNPKGMYSLYL